MSEEKISSTDTREVFVRLLDEGTDVRRPTMAIALGGTRYQLLATDDYDPDEEHWEFPPDSVVDCGNQWIAGREVLVVRARID